MEQDKGQLIAYQVEQAATNTEKLDALIELEEFNYRIPPHKQLELGERILAAAYQQDDPEIIARAHLTCANALYRQSKIQPSLAQASKALTIGERFNLYPLVADAHEALGRIYEDLGIYAEALNHLLEALRHYDSVKNHKGIAIVYIDIGMNYGRQHNYQEALRQFMQALRLCEQHESEISPVILSIAACFIGYAYVSLGDYDQAQNYVDRFLPIAEANQYHLGISNAWVIRGHVYMYQTRYEEAADAYARGLEAAERSEMLTQIANIYKLTGELYYCRGKYDTALEWVHRAAETAERSESMMRCIEAYELLPQIYIAAGRYQEATYAYQKFFDLRQKIDIEQQNSRAAVLQTVYQVHGARMETNLAQIKAEALMQEIRQRDTIITNLDSFAQQVAHDLKNPLNNVLNYTIMLQGDLNKSGTAAQAQMLDTVVEEARRMTGIINTMLQIARVRHEEVQPQPVDMSMIVRTALGRIKPLAAQYKAEISIQTPLPMVLGIPGWLEEVWFNYLSNAMKYGGIPPRIEIGAMDQGSQICFWVRDNGNGIAPEDFPKLFSQFKRLGKSDAEGHGIGLSIVKTIVEKLNGTVGVESSGIAGEGTTFTFSLAKIPRDNIRRFDYKDSLISSASLGVIPGTAVS